MFSVFGYWYSFCFTHSCLRGSRRSYHVLFSEAAEASRQFKKKKISYGYIHKLSRPSKWQSVSSRMQRRHKPCITAAQKHTPPDHRQLSFHVQNSRDGVTGCRAGLSFFLSALVWGSYLRWNSVACASFFFIFFSMLDMDMDWKKRSPTLARVGILRTQRQQQNQPTDNAERGRLCTTAAAQSSGPSLKDLSS